MDDIKDIIAANLVELRTRAHLTQLQVAEKINYTDKAVSKWERGEAIPDLRVLIKLAELYNITLDDLVSPNFKEKKLKPRMNITKKRLLVTMLSVGLTCFVMTFIFMIFYFITATEEYAYLVFVCTPFACSIPLMVFSAKWGNWITNTVACSLIVWSVAIIFHLFVRAFTDFNKIFFIYIVAGVFELLIVWWFMLRKLVKRKK